LCLAQSLVVSKAGMGVTDSVQRILILSIGHPHASFAGNVVGFEGRAHKCACRALHLAAWQDHEPGR
jgi:hypothetical protein